MFWADIGVGTLGVVGALALLFVLLCIGTAKLPKILSNSSRDNWSIFGTGRHR